MSTAGCGQHFNMRRHLELVQSLPGCSACRGCEVHWKSLDQMRQRPRLRSEMESPQLSSSCTQPIVPTEFQQDIVMPILCVDVPIPKVHANITVPAVQPGESLISSPVFVLHCAYGGSEGNSGLVGG